MLTRDLFAIDNLLVLHLQQPSGYGINWVYSRSVCKKRISTRPTFSERESLRTTNWLTYVSDQEMRVILRVKSAGSESLHPDHSRLSTKILFFPRDILFTFFLSPDIIKIYVSAISTTCSSFTSMTSVNDKRHEQFRTPNEGFQDTFIYRTMIDWIHALTWRNRRSIFSCSTLISDSFGQAALRYESETDQRYLLDYICQRWFRSTVLRGRCRPESFANPSVTRSRPADLRCATLCGPMTSTSSKPPAGLTYNYQPPPRPRSSPAGNRSLTIPTSISATQLHYSRGS